jgi:polyisoprenoid-binding protein YceI
MLRNLVLATALVATPALAHAADWTVDTAHSTASFTVKHMMVSTVRGEFSKITGKVNLDEKDLTKSTLEATIDASTVNTREPKRDAHLKSPDFFDVAKFPNLTFKSTKITKAGKGHYKMAGDLTMRGVTKPVTFDVVGFDDANKSPWGTEVRGGVATATVNRKDFGLNWNKPLEKAGGMLVGDNVDITLDVELIQAPPETAAQK